MRDEPAIAEPDGWFVVAALRSELRLFGHTIVSASRWGAPRIARPAVMARGRQVHVDADAAKVADPRHLATGTAARHVPIPHALPYLRQPAGRPDRSQALKVLRTTERVVDTAGDAGYLAVSSRADGAPGP